MATNIFVMLSSSVFFFLSAVFGVSSALPWTGPRPTGVYKEAAWSPAPTFITGSPVELFKRTSVDASVCGWIGGKSDIAATCSSGSRCIRDTNHKVVGCCSIAGLCTQGVYTSCVDVNSAGWTPNAGIQNDGIYTCAGTSVCYKNTYDGGYFQYGCGDSGDAAQVETTYTGQASGISLQVIYTTVYFSSTTSISSLPTTTSSPTSNSVIPALLTSSSTTSSTSVDSTTELASPTVSSTNTTSTLATSSTPTTAPTQNQKSSIIIGAVVAGVAATTGILALLLCFCRFKQNKTLARTSSQTTQHKRGDSPDSSTFERISPYAPEDIGSNRRNITPEEQDITGAFIYGGPEMQQPSGAAERWGLIGNATLMMENIPLVPYEPEDYSRRYNNAISGLDTEAYDANMATGPGMSASFLRSATRNISVHETRDQQMMAESPIISPLSPNHAQTFFPQEDGWTPDGLYTNTQPEASSRSSSSSSLPPSQSQSQPSSISKSSSYSNSSSGDGDVSPEIPIPPKSPLRQNRNRITSLDSELDLRWAVNTDNTGLVPIAIKVLVMTADSPVDASKKRYQLVDEVVRDDVPILSMPGKGRGTGMGTRGRRRTLRGDGRSVSVT